MHHRGGSGIALVSSGGFLSLCFVLLLTARLIPLQETGWRLATGPNQATDEREEPTRSEPVLRVV